MTAMEVIYNDLETIPCQDDGLKSALRADADAELATALEQVKAPGNYKDADKIAAYIDDARVKLMQEHETKCEEAWLRTGLDGGLGHICVIGYAFGDRDPEAITARHDVLGDEAAALREFFGILNSLGAGARLTWVGHNWLGFDLPFLWKRAMVLDVRPPFHLPRNPKPWSENVFDTMLQWDSQQRAGGSMDRICRILGIEGKGDISGKDVWPLVQAGRLDEVATYCKGDIHRTRAMHKRMVFADHQLPQAA